MCGGAQRITPARAHRPHWPAVQAQPRGQPFIPGGGLGALALPQIPGGRRGGGFSCGPQRPRSAPPFRRPPHPHPPHAAATTTARTRTRRAGSSGWRAEAQGTRESGKTLGSPESQALSVQVEPSIASETDHW